MRQDFRSLSAALDAVRELDELAAARGIATGSLYGGILWALIGLALSILLGPG